MKKFIYSVIALTTSLSVTVSAQSTSSVSYVKGYVITLKGDTVKGEIKINQKKEVEPYSKVSVKTQTGEVKTFKPEKTKLYVADNVTYVSKAFSGEAFFFKVLSKGAITLYELHFEEASVSNANEALIKAEFFMEKSDGGEIVKIKSGKFKKQVGEVMQDNEAIVEGINEKKYTYDNIQELFEDYNKQAQGQTKG